MWDMIILGGMKKGGKQIGSDSLQATMHIWLPAACLLNSVWMQDHFDVAGTATKGCLKEIRTPFSFGHLDLFGVFFPLSFIRNGHQCKIGIDRSVELHLLYTFVL
jgi:hypothetical protein